MQCSVEIPIDICFIVHGYHWRYPCKDSVVCRGMVDIQDMYVESLWDVRTEKTCTLSILVTVAEGGFVYVAEM